MDAGDHLFLLILMDGAFKIDQSCVGYRMRAISDGVGAFVDWILTVFS